MTDIGRAAISITTADAFQPYTSVTVKTGEDSDAKSYTAGDTTAGRNLEVIIPYGNATIAQNILSRVNGFTYQPFTANGAMVDPATEIGDGIKIGGIESAMLSQDIKFGGVMSSTIGAPGEEEIDHEIQYIPHERRTVNRAISAVSSGLAQAREDIDEVETGVRKIMIENDDGSWTVGEALYATFIGKDAKGNDIIKEANLSASIVKDSVGNMKSLAQITADSVFVNGNLEVANGYLTVKDKGLYCGKASYIYRMETENVRTKGLTFGYNGSSYVFTPQQITLEGQPVYLLTM